MSEEKCPFCEGTTSVAYHCGNNLLYCHDCKRTFSERDAKIIKLNARIAELEQQLSEKITGETSDGYHTFNELYHHRAVLFSVICRCFPERSWKSRKHHDGTMYSGMFIVGIETDNGQATYHYDIEPYWDMFPVKELEQAPEWDGHTPQEAIERIGKMQIRPFAELEQEKRDQLIDYENRLCEARKYQQGAIRRCEEMEAECVRVRKALERVVKLLDRPMLKDDMCLYMDNAIRVAREAMKGAGDE